MDPLTLSLLIGAGSSIAGGFMGADASKKAQAAQEAAIANAKGLTQQGTDAAVAGIKAQQPFFDQGYAAQQGAQGAAQGDLTKAAGNFDPYVQSGTNAWTKFNDAIGANGGDAQAGFYKGFQADPGWEAAQKAGLNAMQASAAARGGLETGGMAKDLMTYGQRGQLDAYNARLAQLQAAGQQGQSAAGQQGQVYNAMSQLAQRGGDIAQTYADKSGAIPLAVGQTQQQGYGQQADYAIGTGNAQAQGAMNQGNAWVNAMSGVGKAAGAYAGYGGGYGAPQAGWGATTTRQPGYAGYAQ
jgi:hypothetical protein